MNRKKRRHDGRVSARTTLKIKYSEISKLCLEPHEFWDDWEDYRDGLRYCKDTKKIRPECARYALWFDVKKYNKKNKLLLQRRKARRIKKAQARYAISKFKTVSAKRFLNDIMKW